jgi:hypothetical protein
MEDIKFNLFLTVDKSIEGMITKLYVAEDLVDHKNPGGAVYRSRSPLGTIGTAVLMSEITAESQKQGFVIKNMQTTTNMSYTDMYKVLFLVDTIIDPTVYNFKDITGSNEFFTYITNDFHQEWNCKEIIKHFNAMCGQVGIKVMSTQLINKEHIAKELL